MAVYKIFPEKDATLYSEYPTANTGADEVVEASITPSEFLLTSTAPQASRMLLQFSTEEIQYLYNTYTFDRAYLKLYTANAANINQPTIIDAYPVYGAWTNGTGKYGDTPATTNGVSWVYQNGSGIDAWPTSSFPANVTASFPTNNKGGGTWYTSSNYPGSQTIDYRKPTDLNIEVSNMVLAWANNGLTNNGLIVKQRTEFVNSSSYAANLKYFSIDTNTIYPPCIELKWSDVNYNPGTLPVIGEDNIYVSLQNNPGLFREGDIHKFRLNVRPKFPTRVFQTAPLYTNNYYLPEASYYAILDVDTNEVIVDYSDPYTKISADDTSSYFVLYMNGLEPERHYKIAIKVVMGSDILYFDENYYFKIEK